MIFMILDEDVSLKTTHSTDTRPRRVSGYFRQQNQVVPLDGVKIPAFSMFHRAMNYLCWVFCRVVIFKMIIVTVI